MVYRAALDVPSQEHRLPSQLRPLLSRSRSAPRYEWAFSLVVPQPQGPLVPEWNFPAAEHRYLEPLVRRLAPFVAVRVSSQLVYGVRLAPELLRPASDGNGVPSREALSRIVNGIEPYLGSSDGSALHFVSYLSSSSSSPSSASHSNTHSNSSSDSSHSNSLKGIPAASFTVPRWGGIALWQNATLPLDGSVLMAVLLPQVRALMGLTSRLVTSPATSDDALVQQEPPDVTQIAPWQLQAWLRERTVENAAISQVTLQSISVLLDKVANIVIRDDVAEHVRTATALSRNALVALAAASSTGNEGNSASASSLQIAFLSSKQALQAAETAFFHPSLLELLYFQDDQKIGIYIPLFVPVVIPVLLAANKLRPFLAAALSVFGKQKAE